MIEPLQLDPITMNTELVRGLEFTFLKSLGEVRSVSGSEERPTRFQDSESVLVCLGSRKDHVDELERIIHHQSRVSI